MIDIDCRAMQHEFTAWTTYDTVPAIADRIHTLLATGRRLTLVRYLLTPHEDPQVEVHPSVTVDPNTAFGPPRLIDHRAQRTRTYTVYFTFTPGVQPISLRGDNVPEASAARDFLHKKPSTRVEVTGLGDGRGNHIQITHWSADTSGVVTRLQLGSPS